MELFQHDSCPIDRASEKSGGGSIIEITRSGSRLVGVVCKNVFGTLRFFS